METPNSSAFQSSGSGGSPHPARQALVVLGMHRSGTSAVAGCLQRLGVEFGPRLMPATEANKKGYYEHIDVVNLHDRLLTALGRGWETASPWPEHWWEEPEAAGRFREELIDLLRRDFKDAVLWGIKDPRLCRLLKWWSPIWRALDTEPVFVLVVRNPLEVATSLHRRDGISITKGLVLWLQHMLEAEADTRGSQRYFLGFRQFVENWSGSLEPLAGALGSHWQKMVTDAEEANRGFLDISQRRSVFEAGREGLPEAVQRVAEWFESRCGGRDHEPAGLPDFLRGMGWAETALREQPAIDRAADLEIELAHARHLAAWYEAERHKARVRSAKYEARLAGAKRPAKPQASQNQ